MALESGTYISDLVATNPVGSTDTVSTLDGHVQLLKSTIKTTFPNVSGAVTPTHTELNYVDGVTSAIQTQLDAKAPTASPTFTGTVLAGAVTLSGGAVSMSGATSVTVPTPTTSTHAVTKAYADALTTGAGTWTLLKSTAASSSATVDFVNGSGGVVIDSTYDEYVVELVNVKPAAGADLWMRTSTNAGSAYDAGVSDYDYAQVGQRASTGTTQSSQNEDVAYIQIGSLVDATTGAGLNGSAKFTNPDAAQYFNVLTTAVHMRSAATDVMCWYGCGVRKTAANVDAIRFLFSTGNIASGTFNLYARKKS